MFHETTSQTRRLVTAVALLVLFILLVRTAWVCEDAYVAFRVTDNVRHGYGLRWNTDERVQAFSSPLWTLVMTGASAVTGEVYYTSIALSICASLAAIFILGGRLSPTAAAATLAFTTLGLSKSFIDYSTSGFENALTHLLLVAFLAVWIAPRPTGSTRSTRLRIGLLAFLCSLLMLNRLDLGLLVLPLLAGVVWRSGRPSLAPAVVGLLPVVLWELFAVVYYGFPLPNAAYAHIVAGGSAAETLHRGILYLFDSLNRDPLTATVLTAAMLVPLIGSGSRAIAVVIAAYITYVVSTGGDSASGRLLTAPFVCAVVQLLQVVPRTVGAEWAGAMSVVCLAALLPGWPSNFSSGQYGPAPKPAADVPEDQIRDERRDDYPSTGLLTAYRGVMMPQSGALVRGYEMRRAGDRVDVADDAGFTGYGAGPAVHVIDRRGFADPLIARLPVESARPAREPLRAIPAGYLETIDQGRNVLRDPAVAAFYERLHVVIAGPLWSTRRWRTILAMNLGRHDGFVADYGKIRVRLDDLTEPKPNQLPWDREGNLLLTLRGADIMLDHPASGGRVEISLSGNDVYTVEFRSGERKVGESTIAQPATPDGSLEIHVIDAPRVPFDVISVRPSAGDGHYSMGHVRLLPG